MERIFGRPIVTQEQMRTRIRELGRQIAADYANKDLVLIGVLKGAYAFYADLARAIRIPMRVEFIVVTSYGVGQKKLGKGEVGLRPHGTDRGQRRSVGRGHCRFRLDHSVPPQNLVQATPSILEGLHAAQQARTSDGRGGSGLCRIQNPQ